MRHYPDLRTAGHTDPRRAKLFELHRQEHRQTEFKCMVEGPETLRADIALALRDQAIRTLRPREPYTPHLR